VEGVTDNNYLSGHATAYAFAEQAFFFENELFNWVFVEKLVCL
jgi:hypothetical protein